MALLWLTSSKKPSLGTREAAVASFLWCCRLAHKQNHEVKGVLHPPVCPCQPQRDLWLPEHSLPYGHTQYTLCQ